MDEPAEAATLLDWLTEPSEDRGIHFAGPGSTWHFHSYAQLAAATRRMALRLREEGAGPGDAVLVVHRNSPEFVTAFFGSLLIGATPVPMAPLSSYRDPGDLRARLAQARAATGARLVVGTPETLGDLGEPTGATGCAVLGHPATDAPGLDGPPASGRDAFVQFSSGSTGSPRGVRVPHRAVEANLRAFMRWLKIRVPRDGMATWLPVHHDMGLVGGLLAPVSVRTNVWMMQPEQFIRDPARWVRCFGEHGATVGVTPNFGLAHVLRRVRAGDLADLDLSGCRALVVGAERVDERVLDSWQRLFGPVGFPARAMVPAYGMAEATLAVTGSDPDEDVLTVRVAAGSLTPGKPVTIASGPGKATAVVGCGRPVPGVRLRIVDEAGDPLPSGVLGEIEIGGEAVADGYLTLDDGRPARTDFGGVFRTGDAGFLHEGQLFVLGRLGDAVKSLGKWLLAEDVEDVAARAAGTSTRPVVLLGTWEGRSTAVVLLSRDTAPHAETVGREITGTFADLDVLAVEVRPAEIRRTTSGKPRRRHIWASLVTPDLAARASWDSRAAAARPDGTG